MKILAIGLPFNIPIYISNALFDLGRRWSWQKHLQFSLFKFQYFLSAYLLPHILTFPYNTWPFNAQFSLHKLSSLKSTSFILITHVYYLGAPTFTHITILKPATFAITLIPNLSYKLSVFYSFNLDTAHGLPT